MRFFSALVLSTILIDGSTNVALAQLPATNINKFKNSNSAFPKGSLTTSQVLFDKSAGVLTSKGKSNVSFVSVDKAQLHVKIEGTGTSLKKALVRYGVVRQKLDRVTKEMSCGLREDGDTVLSVDGKTPARSMAVVGSFALIDLPADRAKLALGKLLPVRGVRILKCFYILSFDQARIPRLQAEEKALARARSRAQEFADSNNLKIVEFLGIENAPPDSEGKVGPQSAMNAPDGFLEIGPLNPGRFPIHCSVTARYKVARATAE